MSAAQEQERSTALAATPQIGTLARRQYAREQIDLIKNTVAKGATDAELDLFLELCARYQLDPFAGQVWCARMRNEDGGERGQMVTMVGRDGMLVIARRFDDFEGVLGDVVREHDDFRVVQRDDNVIVTHGYGKPSERGEIVGAWAKVTRRDEKPTYFFAPFEEYAPPRDTKRWKKTPWSSNTSAMILKCAQSTALRFAYSITGLVGAEEISRHLDPGDVTRGIDEGEIEWGDDPEVADRLQQLFAVANEVKTDAFRPRKIQGMLAGRTEGERRQIALDLERFIEANGGEVPPPPADNTVDDPSEEIEDADYRLLTPEEQAAADEIPFGDDPQQQ
jgi:phage recombination protein Bet